MKNTYAKQYLAADKKLMTLIKGGRKEGAPTSVQWTGDDFKQSDEVVLKWTGALGWILGASDFVIDIDPRNGGSESFEKLLEEFPELRELLIPTVITPRGGYHIYLRMPEKYIGDRFRKALNKDYPGIDWLTKGAYCVICGSEKTNDGVLGKYTWVDEDFGEFEQEVEVPEAVIGLVRYADRKVGKKVDRNSDNGAGSDDDMGDFEGKVGGVDSIHWSEAAVLEMLGKLDNNMPNEDWARVGMALQDWDPSRGLELWEKWSRGGDTYKEGETSKRWRSFDVGDGTTMGTISYMAKDADYDDVSMKVAIVVSRISGASEKELEFEIFGYIKKMGLDRLNKEKLVKAIQDRYKALSGVRMPVSGIRQSISGYGGGGEGGSAVSGHFIEEGGDAPSWCDDWLYVNSHTGFMDLRTFKLHKAESFNNKNGKFIPENETGSKPAASKYVADKGFLDNVDSMCYLPTREERICMFNGSRVLNSFNRDSLPVVATEFTEEGLGAIRLLQRHIRIICGNEKGGTGGMGGMGGQDAGILEQWIAHQVQYPGRQILWAPVIQSIQGIGKSLFAELLRALLGDCNVGTVSPTQITSDFNGWATGVCVNFLEEFRVKGHNRHEAVNALKPLITDRIIQINEKGVKPYMTQNTTNYMGLTNEKDAIPMDMDDRRWWVIFVAINSLSEMSVLVGEDTSVYFPRLFNAIRTHGDELRKWFLEYDISKEFLATKQAPMTDSKLAMIATEEASFEGLSEVRELIEEGHKYYNEECVSSSDLFDQLAFKHPDVEVTNRSKNTIMKKLGYMIVGGLVKIDKKPRRIWTKKKMTNDMIRIQFSKKVTGEDDL